ncbi:MAG: hypothetical protein QNJ72_27010 [Pleurocapsa sp. MO_226.B13]|nr:hypothetical protein [Pleurocapsa sp. MO_226.B13]
MGGNSTDDVALMGNEFDLIEAGMNSKSNNRGNVAFSATPSGDLSPWQYFCQASFKSKIITIVVLLIIL